MLVCSCPLASFPVPRPAFRRLTVLQATKSWAWDWERGYLPTVVCSCPQTGALIVTPTRELATQIAGVLRVLLPPSLSLAVLIGGRDPQRDTHLLKTQG